MQALLKYGQRESIFNDFNIFGCDQEDLYYYYLDDNNEVQFYKLNVDYTGVEFTKGATVGFGYILYNKQQIVVCSTPTQCAEAVKDFGKVLSKHVLSVCSDELKGSAKQALRSMVLELLPSDLSDAFSVTTKLHDERTELKNLYNLLKQ